MSFNLPKLRWEVTVVTTKYAIRRVMRTLAVSVILVLATTTLASDEGQIVADQVSLASYQDFMNNWLYTHVGDNRGYGPEHDLARDNIADLFESYGLTVELEPFSYGGTYYNVVATKMGTTYPFQEYIIGAHYDSVDNPGADDDASGVALMLEVARIVSQYDSAYTIRFIAFDREEQGLIGSNAYVDDHFGDDILGMVQADMVAYDPDTNNALIYGHANPVKTALAGAVLEYSGGLTYTDGGWNGQSDHAPFDAAGFDACLLIEGEVWNNPYYHTQDDNYENPDNLNFEYAVKMVRSIAGWLVDAAELNVPVDAVGFTYPDGRPTFIAPAGGTRMRVETYGIGASVPQPGSGVLHYDVGAGWQTMAMDDIADNIYDAVFPAVTCTDEISYYVSALAVGGEVFTDPRTAPATSYTAVSAYGETVLFADDCESNLGWTVSGDALDGQWNRGVPVGLGERGDPPTDYDGSGQCYLTDNVYGNSDVDDGYTYLTSPAIDLSAGDAEI
ncbi:MAG: M28 family peptidase, partial [Planctomycetota bacterium]